MERFKQKLQAAAIPFRENEPLAAHCTFKIGGPAKLFVMPETRAAALQCSCALQEAGCPLLPAGQRQQHPVCGRRLFRRGDRCFGTGRRDRGGRYSPDRRRRCPPCGTVQAALKHGLSGLEFALRHPRHGGRCSVYECRCLRRRDEGRAHHSAVSCGRRRGQKSACRRAGSPLSPQHFLKKRRLHPLGTVPSAAGNAADIRAKMDELMAKRVEKQPLDKPSAGSTFKRPAGAFAAA